MFHDFIKWLKLSTVLVTDLMLGIMQEIKMLNDARRFAEERYEIHSINAINVNDHLDLLPDLVSQPYLKCTFHDFIKWLKLPTLLVTDLMLGIIQEIKMLIYARRFAEERYEIHSIIAINVNDHLDL